MSKVYAGLIFCVLLLCATGFANPANHSPDFGNSLAKSAVTGSFDVGMNNRGAAIDIHDNAASQTISTHTFVAFDKNSNEDSSDDNDIENENENDNDKDGGGVTAAATPEPGALVLMGSGLVILFARKRLKRSF